MPSDFIAQGKISGFTMLRNGSKFDYPYLESLRSLLPLVDELVVNVGVGEDDTLTHIQNFAKEVGLNLGGESKVQIFESIWDFQNPEKRKGGKILAEQTNLALGKCSGDWCIYLQADEVIHEADYSLIREAINRATSQPDVEGLLFDYIHFYGSYDVIQKTRSSYRREVRAIRRSSGAVSVGDAQSFRKRSGEKLKVIHSGARIFHYGWVRTPEAMREKTVFMDRLYHSTAKGGASSAEEPFTGNNYHYKRFWGLCSFRSTHPRVMQKRIQDKGWHWDLTNSPWVWSWGDLTKVILDLFEVATGIRLFEYRSYRLKRESYPRKART